MTLPEPLLLTALLLGAAVGGAFMIAAHRKWSSPREDWRGQTRTERYLQEELGEKDERDMPFSYLFLSSLLIVVLGAYRPRSAAYTPCSR